MVKSGPVFCAVWRIPLVGDMERPGLLGSTMLSGARRGTGIGTTAGCSCSATALASRSVSGATIRRCSSSEDVQTLSRSAAEHGGRRQQSGRAPGAVEHADRAGQFGRQQQRLRHCTATRLSDCCGGTLGSLIQNASGTQYLLSNNHVLARSDQASMGDTIVQPGLIDDNCTPYGAGRHGDAGGHAHRLGCSTELRTQRMRMRPSPR